MFDFNYDRLKSVDIRAVSQDGDDLLLWRITREDEHSIPEGAWMYGQAKITHDNSTQGALLDQGFWIEVTALANEDPHGFIAFDNFEVIRDSDCTIMPPGAYPTQCKDDEFRCFDDNTCISNVRHLSDVLAKR